MRWALLHRQEIHQQQALCVIEANAPVALIEDLGQQVQPRDDLAELNGKTEVTALLRYFIGKQQQHAIGILTLAEQPGGLFDIARGIADKLRVDRVGHIELRAPAVSGHEHAANRIDERADAVAAKVGAQGIAQGSQVTPVTQCGQGLAIFDGLADFPGGGHRIRIPRLTPLVGVAQVELAHQQVEALQVVTHPQGGHAVDAGLEELIGLAVAELPGDIAALLLAATHCTQREHRSQQQRPSGGKNRKRSIHRHRV